MVKKPDPKPFQRLQILQTLEDIKDIDCQFAQSGGTANMESYLECQDCHCTNIVFNALIEAEISVDIVGNVEGTEEKKVHVISIAKCYLCEGTNIERVNYNLSQQKNGESGRLVPRYPEGYRENLD